MRGAGGRRKRARAACPGRARCGTFTRVRSRARLVVLLSLLASEAGGCTLAYGYPESHPELCDNGVDDDLDGRIDCDDTCEGRCPEDVARACHDGRDDDGDGLIDFADPGCWPLADVTLESCASTPSTHAVLDFDGTDESWAARPGDLGPDPSGIADGSVLLAHDGVDAREVHLLTGRTIGTRARMRVALDPSTDYAHLVLDVQDGVVLVDRLRATLGMGTLVAEAQTLDQRVLDPLPPGTYELSIEVVDAETVRVAVASAGTELASLTTAIPPDGWLDAQAFSLRIELEAGGASPVVVDQVTVDRDPVTFCGDLEPIPRDGTPFSGFVPRALVASESLGHCALGTSIYDEAGLPRLPATPALARSEDRGHAWAVDVRAELWRLGLGRTRDLVGGTLVEGRVHTLLWDGLGDTRIATTTDCVTVEIAERIPAGADLEIRGYGLDGARHEIYAIDHGRLVVRAFAAGDASFDTEAVTDLADPMGVGWVARIGDDLVVRDDTVPPTLSVVSMGARTEHVGDTLRPFLTVRGSGRAGACDEFRARDPVLAIDGAPRGTGAAATGVVLVDCVGRETFAPSIVGVVPHELVIRAR